MGERGGQSTTGFHNTLSSREEASGKRHSHNAKSLLKLKHLQNLALFGHEKDAKFGCWVPSLVAFLLNLGSLWGFLLTLLFSLVKDAKQFFNLVSTALFE